MSVYLSVIIPCYNEEKRFKSGSRHYFEYLKKQKYNWELIFINDGSKDNTLKLIKDASQKNFHISLVSYNENRGKGYAIVQGINKAQGKFILFSDIDHSVPIKTIENFFDFFKKEYKVIIGSRRVKGAKFLKRQHFIRESLGRGFTFLTRILIDWKIKDATCGFKAFENKVAKKLFAKITIYDWAFDAELLFLCKKYHLNYAQAPVAWKDVRGSKVSIGKDVLRSLIGLLKIRLNDIQGKYDQ